MKLKKLILSCFGLGYLPLAPGTWGSLQAVAILFIVYYFWHQGVVCGIVIAAAMVVSSVICLLFAGEAEKQEGKKDPRWIVIDEFAGQCIAILPVAVKGENVLIAGIAGFAFFRIFDILKPPPIRECELIDGSVGILADDIVAGLMAGVTVQVISYLFTFFR
jgi:phosphatidylglycerophosphatase A